jgi:EF-P beta-lysylation protein EpmB
MLHSQPDRAILPVKTLLGQLGLDAASSPWRIDFNPGYPLLVPRPFLELIRRGDWNDPLLLQVLPLLEERRNMKGFSCDPVGDVRSAAAPGLLHKYRGRVLLYATQACAIHCRYCFRRCLAAEQPKGLCLDVPAAVKYIRCNPDIREAVLSGGDPFMLGTGSLSRIIKPLLRIPGLETIRFHTRVPLVLPSRVDQKLCSLISQIASLKTCIVMIHANCAQEIGGTGAAALRSLRAANAVLFNQSVLLKGINDCAQTLAVLSRRLIENGVAPCYIHQLDRVRGAHHFKVGRRDGLRIMNELRELVPGHSLPRYVREVPGAPSKCPIC